jgi:MFS family permease
VVSPDRASTECPLHAGRTQASASQTRAAGTAPRTPTAGIVAEVRPLPVPSFISDLFVDRVARGALLAGSVALFAAAMDPQAWSPALPSIQAAVRENSQLETLVLLASISASGLILLGGAVGDSRRARPVILGGLAVELLASVVALLVPSGPVFLTARLVGHAGAAFVIPVSIALVATSYKGAVRATAIGIAYGAYGAAGAAAPILLQLSPGQQWPGFLAAIVACAVAIRLSWTRNLELRRPSLAERPLVVGVAFWAFGIITFTVGLTWIDSAIDNPIRWALIIGGPALVLGYIRLSRARAVLPARIIRRRVAIALFVGVVIAISQTAAMLNLPLYFNLVLDYGPLWGTVALAPLFVALVLAGPVAGFLLERVKPRWLVGGGVIVVGIGNLALAAVSSGSASYASFVIPCLLVGAGFVVATTVRTAIIFASVPEGLPATAAALNEASIAVGSRIGIVLVSAIVAQVALSTYTASIAGLPAADATAAIAAFRTVLVAVGTPSFDVVATTVASADIRPYADAYVAGLNSAFVFCGVVGVIGGAIALLAFGRQDPLKTVWDNRDERASVGAVVEVPA